MNSAIPIKIPITFLAEAPTKALCVDEAGFRRRMGYDTKSPSAAKSASYDFRTRNQIPTLTGGVYPIEAIEAAVRAEAKRNGARKRK